jgi:hypothetical protein
VGTLIGMARFRLAACGFVLGLLLIPASAGAATLLSTTVDVHAHQRFSPRSVPRSFVGLSYEFNHVAFLTGGVPYVPVAADLNAAAVGLFGNITRYGNGPPTIRVGGTSSDESWWNPEGRTFPAGIHINLGPVWMDSVRRFLDATGSRAILGLNLAKNRPYIAAELAEAARRGLGSSRIRAFELGNEPDIYATRKYTKVGKKIRPARPGGYKFSTYLKELRRLIRAVKPAAGGIPLAGPAACCHEPWYGGLKALLRSNRDIKLATYHAYPLGACGRSRHDPDYASVRNLLRDSPVASHLLPFIEVAARAHRRIRLTESNSVSCGGKPGVSDTLAAGIWGADWLFGWTFWGMEGVDLHTSGSYAPFDFALVDGQWRAYVRPLYYGMLLYAAATADGGRIIRDPTLFATRPTGANARVYVVQGHDGSLRVAIFNRELRRGGAVRIHIPGSTSQGAVMRLTGKRARSTQGVTFAGQSVPRGSTDGALVGDPVKEAVRPSHGVYTVQMPKVSAALLTVPG